MSLIYNGTLYTYQAKPDRIYLALNMGGLTGSAPTTSGWTPLWVDPVNFADLSQHIEYGQLGSSGIGFRTPNTGSGSNNWGVLLNSAMGGAGVNANGIYPNEVMEQYWFTNSTTGSIILYNFSSSNVLTSDKSFTFRFFGSRGGIVGPRRTIYTIGTQSASLDVANNSSSYVDITNVVPSASTIWIKIRNTVADSTFGYLNAMFIIEQ